VKRILQNTPKWLFLLVVIVTIVVLSACGTSTTTTTKTTTATTTTTTTAATTTPAPTTTIVSGGGSGTVEVLGTWGGEELDSFNAMVAPWETQTGNIVNFTGTRDLTAILTTRVQANNPPDIAILPNPGFMNQLAKAGNLVPLNNFLDMNQINSDYAQGWVDLGTVNSNLYAIFMKASDKGTVWYNPKVFTENNWSVPGTWDEMITLSNQIVSEGKVPAAPWSIAVESGAASGWPATDWMAEILLRKYGGDVYDGLVNHTIPWTDSRIKDVWQMFGTVALTPGYVPGGATAVLATNFQDGTYLPFDTPPKAAMDYLGDFTAGFISAQFPDLVAGQDYSFFPFPTIDSQYSGGVTGGADLLVVFKDSPEVESLVTYLAGADAQTIWVKRGGFTSVNNKVALSNYPDAITKAAAQQLTQATLFRFGAGDSMPSAVQTAWWAGVLSYLQDPTQLDNVLANIESVAATSY
jgi:alpha-glucoside transport system substrate-binding protein